MDQHVGEDIAAQEIPQKEEVIMSSKSEYGEPVVGTTAAPALSGKDVKAEADAPSRDAGDWKFKPWNGVDHWVHEKTGASTFDLKKIPEEYL